MKYLFLMYGPETAWSEAERKECMVGSLAICQELNAAGKFIATAPLDSVTTAVTLRNRGATPMVMDGPFAETTEQLGGFFLLDLADLDEAIAVASKLPSITKGTAEIRPVLPMEGLPPLQPIPIESKLKPYMLISYDDVAAWQAAGPAVMEQTKAGGLAVCRELHDQARLILVCPLQPAETATCVKSRNGRVLITDGPYSETREVLGGFYVILAESRDAAVAVARRHPCGNRSDVEVRPLFDIAPLKKTLGFTF